MIKTKNKILIVSEYFYPEDFKITDVALYWSNKGYSVDVLTLAPSYPEGRIYPGYKNKFYFKEKYENILIHHLKTIQGYKESVIIKIIKYFWFMIYSSLWAIKNGNKYDFILGYSTGPLTAMLSVTLIKKLYKKPTTLWIQDIWPDTVYAYGFKKRYITHFFLNKFTRFIYNNTTRFAIDSNGVKSILNSFIDSKREMKFIPYWPDGIDLNSKKFKFSENNKINFTFAGNLGKVQNLNKIIDAFISLPDDMISRAQLNFVGDGSAVDHLKQKYQNYIDQNIYFWGRQPRDSMSKFYNGSSFLIISLIDKPIFSITIPGKFQTCIETQKPILGFINGETADLINDYNLGFTAPPSDILAIKDIFIKCIQMDYNDYKNFKISSIKLLEEKYNKTKILDNLTKLVCK